MIIAYIEFILQVMRIFAWLVADFGPGLMSDYGRAAAAIFAAALSKKDCYKIEQFRNIADNLITLRYHR